MSTQGQGDVASRANIMADMLTAGDRIRYGDDAALLRELAAEITRLRTLLSLSRGEQGWRTIDSAPKDGTHIIGNTQWGASEIWWHKDTYEGEYWTDEGDSEPEPTGWIPMPGPVPASLAGQVPDGYVLVPKEPTEEMIEAGNQACDMNCHLGGFEQGHVYRAMLSAAPQPTAGGDAP